MGLLGVPKFLKKETELKFEYYEDDKDDSVFLLKVNGVFPEVVIKQIYNGAIKGRLGVPFKVALKEGEEIDVPLDMLIKKFGFFSYEDLLLDSLLKLFIKLERKYRINIYERHIQRLLIKRIDATNFMIFYEILGKKHSLTHRK